VPQVSAEQAVTLLPPRPGLDSFPAMERWHNDRERGDADPVVRTAVDNVTRNLAALSASEIVQLVLYPEPLAGWAEGAGVDESQVANLFRRHRIYARVRQLLAERLGVPLTVLAHLVDAAPAAPSTHRSAIHAEVLRSAGLPSTDERPPIDWRSPPYPGYREGTNPLERLALASLTAGAASMPSSRIVGYALWPESLAGFAARSGRFTLGQLLTALSGLRRADYIETALARRLNLSRGSLERFIVASRRDPFTPAAAS
jgi:hypothetical protein